MKKIFVIFFVLLICRNIYADGGFIPYDPIAEIFMPNQNAIIAWNGAEEILVLSNDLSASKETNILHVVPFPSQPEVKKADKDIFEKATNILKKILTTEFDFYANWANRQKSAPTGGINGVIKEIPAGKVVYKKRIGVHDISVIKVISKEQFVEWVIDYLTSKRVTKPVISDEMKDIIKVYLNDDIKWFAFDIISITKETSTVDPIQYTFKTNYLYYPMRISRTGSGHVEIKLVIISWNLLNNFYGYRPTLLHPPVAINYTQIKEISSDIYKLFFRSDKRGEISMDSRNIKLRIWTTNGNLDTLTKDIIAK